MGILAVRLSRPVTALLRKGATMTIFSTEQLPYHWIVEDADGLAIVPNIPGGWRSRRPYRGSAQALTPLVGATVDSMIVFLGVAERVTT